MQSEFTNGFNKIIQVCKQTGILRLGSTEKSLKKIQYGPLGSLLKRNVFREWLFSHLSNPDISAYPLDLQTPREKCIVTQKSHDRHSSSLLLDVVNHYFDILPMNGSVLPFGIAAYGPCIKKSKRIAGTNFDHGAFFRDLETWIRLSMIYFCSAQQSMHWFHYWSRNRYRWWRKFSSIPSRFSLSDVTETSSGDQQLFIMHEYPWGKEKLERVTLFQDGCFQDLCLKHGIEHKLDNSSAPSVIACETELDLAVFAYLTNSFAEKWRDEETKNVFQFHIKLAPYKVYMSLFGSNVEVLKKLTDVANHLMNQIKKADICIFPHFQVNSISNPQIDVSKLDEMGVPYAIILNENTLLTGVAGLRNRDTTVQEQVHITELTMKLQRYLQIKTQIYVPDLVT